MTRDDMIDLLLPALVRAGMGMAPARRRLWTMSHSALEREVLLRGLAEYEDPPEYDEEDAAESVRECMGGSALGWSCAPVYND